MPAAQPVGTSVPNLEGRTWMGLGVIGASTKVRWPGLNDQTQRLIPEAGEGFKKP